MNKPTIEESEVRRLIMSCYREATGKYTLARDADLSISMGEEAYEDFTSECDESFITLIGKDIAMSSYDYPSFISKLEYYALFYNQPYTFNMTEVQEDRLESNPSKMWNDLVDLLDTIQEDGSPTAQYIAENLEVVLKKHLGEWER